MKRSERQRITGSSLALLITSVLIGTTALQAAPAQQVNEARVSLSKGARIDQVIAELARATDGVCVADVSVKDRALQDDLKGVSLRDALAQISEDFDVYWVRRGRMVSLQLRRTDPDEPDLTEMEELRVIAADLDRLVATTTGGIREQDIPKLRARFVASLTAQQQQVAIRQGLAYGQLTPSQQQLLVRVNSVHHYRAPVRELRRASLAINGLERCQLESLTRRSIRTLMVRFSDPQSPGGRGSVQLNLPKQGFDRPTSAAAAREQFPGVASSPGASNYRGLDGEERPVPTTASTGTPWTSAARRMSLAQFSAEWRRGIGTPLRIPAYAAGRGFWICSVGSPRSGAAKALAALWGWEYSAIPDGRRLGRPSFGAASTDAERAEAIHRAIPPAIWNPAMSASIRNDFRRRRQQLQTVIKEGERVGGADWQIVSVARLSNAARLVLANAILQQRVALSTNPLLPPGTIPEYLSSPQQIIMRLDGPLGGAKLPNIDIKAGQGGVGLACAHAVGTAYRHCGRSSIRSSIARRTASTGSRSTR